MGRSSQLGGSAGKSPNLVPLAHSNADIPYIYTLILIIAYFYEFAYPIVFSELLYCKEELGFLCVLADTVCK